MSCGEVLAGPWDRFVGGGGGTFGAPPWFDWGCWDGTSVSWEAEGGWVPEWAADWGREFWGASLGLHTAGDAPGLLGMAGRLRLR